MPPVNMIYRAEAKPWWALTDSATIIVDASISNMFKVTLGGNRTMGAPSNPTDGQVIMFRFKQDATGNRKLTWAAAYRFATALSLSKPGNTVDYVTFIYEATDGFWDCIDRQLGY